jgi:hypothetical protein
MALPATQCLPCWVTPLAESDSLSGASPVREVEVGRHYERRLGAPVRVVEYSEEVDGAPAQIFVAEFRPVSDDTDWVYATIGMSGRPQPGSQAPADGEDGLRVELYIMSRTQQAELSESLAALALYPFVNQTMLDAGHTIAGIEGQGIAAGSPLTEILIIPSVPPDPVFDQIRHANGTETSVLCVIPIHRSERLFAVERGWHELIHLFFERGTDTSDLWRGPAC